MADYEAIPKSNGMYVLRNVVDLENGILQHVVVIRILTEKFWQACIDTVGTPNKRYPLPHLRYWNAWYGKGDLDSNPYSHAAVERSHGYVPCESMVL